MINLDINTSDPLLWLEQQLQLRDQQQAQAAGLNEVIPQQQDLEQQQLIFPMQSPPFYSLEVWKSVNLDTPEIIGLFHSSLYRATMSENLDSSDFKINQLIRFIQYEPEILKAFKNSILSKPANDIEDYIKKLCHSILPHSEIPLWAHTNSTELENIPRNEEPSLFSIENELLQCCVEGKLPVNYDALKRLELINWISLRDNQKRPLLHIIFNQGPTPLIQGRKDAICELVKLCPSLLIITDSNQETIIDLLFKNNEDFFFYLNAAYPEIQESNNPWFAQVTCQCYAKEAESIIEKFPISGKITLQTIDSLPPEHNPIMVCKKLGKQNLAEILMNGLIPDFFDDFEVFSDDKNFVNAIYWKDAPLAAFYFKLLPKNSSGLIPQFADRMVQIGCNKQINDFIELNAKSKLKDKEFNCHGNLNCNVKKIIIASSFCPLFLKSYDFLKMLNNSEKIMILNRILEKFYKDYDSLNFNESTKEKVEIIGMIIEDLFQSDYFLARKLKFNIVGGEIDISILIPYIEKQNRLLGEKIFRACIEQGLKETLFNSLCMGLLLTLNSYPSQINLPDFFEWSIPLLKENNVPLNLTLSPDHSVLRKLITFIKPIRALGFFEHLESLISSENLCELLQLCDYSNSMPIEYLCAVKYFDDVNNKAAFSLIRKFIILSYRIEDINNIQVTKEIILKIILLGDQELDKLCNIDTIALKFLSIHDEFAPTNYSFLNLIKCDNPVRVKKFLKLLNSFPLSLQKELLNYDLHHISMPFTLELFFINVLENNDEELLELFLALDPLILSIWNYEINIKIVDYLLETRRLTFYNPIPTKNSNIDLLKKLLTHIKYDDKLASFVIGSIHYLLDLDRKFLICNTNVIEIILDHYLDGKFEIPHPHLANFKNEKNISRLLENTLLQLNGDEKKASISFEETIYTVKCIEAQNRFEYLQVSLDEIIIGNGFFTKKGVLDLIKKHVENKKINLQINLLKDTKNLKGYGIDCLITNDEQLLDRHFFMQRHNGIFSYLWIVNKPSAKKICVYYVDFNSGTIEVKDFAYMQENLANELKLFINVIRKDFIDRQNLIYSHFPQDDSISSIEKFIGSAKHCHVSIHPAGLFTHILHRLPFEPFNIQQAIKGIPSEQILASYIEKGNIRVQALNDAFSHNIMIKLHHNTNQTFIFHF
ncbi:MAG: hypothetical protein H0V82_09220 [Candidatus Protochlamydia sp.]|nr:hypothetical protein [Candidatus Protochlamydia sp.]